MEFKIKRAERAAVSLRLAVIGPSGSGKTWSSIVLARGLVGKNGKILVIDTENGSANLYADMNIYDVLELDPPYTVQAYTKALDMAKEAGYDAVIIDSYSHAWAAEGGLLDKKQGLDSRGGNSYTNWATITKEHEFLKSRILTAPYHVIATMRSKQEYVLEVNEKGKQVPKKVGMAPIQRDSTEYEFTTVFDLGMDHQFQVSKDRTGLFDGVIKKIDYKTGELLANWLKSVYPKEILDATPIESPAESANAAIQQAIESTDSINALRKAIMAEVARIGWKLVDWQQYARSKYKKDSTQLTAEQLKEELEHFKNEMSHAEKN